MFKNRAHRISRLYKRPLISYNPLGAKFLRFSNQRGMVFLFFGNHIQNCRSSEKIGRKEIILRFFFSLGNWHEKKNRGVKNRDLIPTGCGFFQVLGFRTNLVDGFFFPDKNPEGKKKP